LEPWNDGDEGLLVGFGAGVASEFRIESLIEYCTKLESNYR
jgi:hypothetical protein